MLDFLVMGKYVYRRFAVCLKLRSFVGRHGHMVGSWLHVDNILGLGKWVQHRGQVGLARKVGATPGPGGG